MSVTFASRVVLLPSFLPIAAASVLALATARGAVDVGSTAPPVEPQEWLNTDKPVTWKDFKGHVILVEKWATWCGPCRQTIPHLNELSQKFAKKGLTIIGVTDEDANTVKPFMKEMGMTYLIAIRGAEEYETSGIPHAWLVGPKGDVVWKGHPGELKESMIEPHLREVRLTPVFSLPKELKSAEKDLNAGKYADGIASLESHLEKPKNAETEEAAKKALKKVRSYGSSRLKEAKSLAKDKQYGEAAAILASLEKGFKGQKQGTEAGELLAGWKKDKAIKLEIDGYRIIEKADELAAAKDYKTAAAALTQVAKAKKFEGTEIRKAALRKLSIVEKKLSGRRA